VKSSVAPLRCRQDCEQCRRGQCRRPVPSSDWPLTHMCRRPILRTADPDIDEGVSKGIHRREGRTKGRENKSWCRVDGLVSGRIEHATGFPAAGWLACGLSAAWVALRGSRDRRGKSRGRSATALEVSPDLAGSGHRLGRADRNSRFAGARGESECGRRGRSEPRRPGWVRTSTA